MGNMSHFMLASKIIRTRTWGTRRSLSASPAKKENAQIGHQAQSNFGMEPVERKTSFRRCVSFASWIRIEPWRRPQIPAVHGSSA